MPPFRVTHPECVEIGQDVRIYEDNWYSVIQSFENITPRLVIGDRVRIGRGCGFAVVGEVIIEPRAILGDFAVLLDTIHPFEEEDRLTAVALPQPVRIGEGAVLGSHVIVLPGVTVGAGALVEHHSVVGRDVAPGTTVAGYPARRVGGQAGRPVGG